MDEIGHARIIDFGLAVVIQNLDSIRGTFNEHDCNSGWSAPEILSNQGSHSKEADVFSFVGVAIEVC